MSTGLWVWFPEMQGTSGGTPPVVTANEMIKRATEQRQVANQAASPC